MLNSISNLLKNKTAESPTLRGAMAALTVEEADKVMTKLFGPGVSKFASAAYVKNRVLAITLRGSAAGQEIKLNEKRILAEINAQFGPSTVQKIRYII